jgi:hypothetical protein
MGGGTEYQGRAGYFCLDAGRNIKQAVFRGELAELRSFLMALFYKKTKGRPIMGRPFS